MSGHLTRKSLHRSIAGAVSLLVLTCVAMFAIARWFVVQRIADDSASEPDAKHAGERLIRTLQASIYHDSDNLEGMHYRGIEYTVVQGIERHIWKWSVAFDADSATGQAATKAEAVSKAERAIDRALAPKKNQLVPPPRRWD